VTAEPCWLSKESLLVLHDRSIALHGGASGLRDEGLLESALARAANRFHHDGDVCAVAATYLVALVSNHPFTDGNKRAAFLAAGLFLRLNGRRLVAEQADAARTVLAAAAGQRDLDALAEWVRRRSITEG
jgi:death-on-curing protein